MAGGVNSNSQLKPKPPTEQQSAAAFQHLPLHIALSSAAGGRRPAVPLAVSLGHAVQSEPQHARQGDGPRQRQEVPHVAAGIKATAVGAATWGIYEGVWTVLEHAASVGENESSL